MMDERTKEILKTVSDWDGEPEEGVAYNIRGKTVSAPAVSPPPIFPLSQKRTDRV